MSTGQKYKNYNLINFSRKLSTGLTIIRFGRVLNKVFGTKKFLILFAIITEL